MTATVLRGDALHLPLADESVDLVVTSPPYFALRSYTDAGEHYAGQLGSEATPAEFVDALLHATREMVRVLKPSGSIWVNLGDKYANPVGSGSAGRKNDRRFINQVKSEAPPIATNHVGVREKSLMGIPWRYALACIDQLGLILRAEVIWSKPNGLPESVTDRVRRSHEQWFHMVRQPRYYSAVDEIREGYEPNSARRKVLYGNNPGRDGLAGLRATGVAQHGSNGVSAMGVGGADMNPLGKLPGSVWTVPTEPLQVPAELGVDHFAAFPTEWPRRIIAGWSPPGVCTECGEGRRPAAVNQWYFDLPGEDMARRALERAHQLGITAEEVATIYGRRIGTGDTTGNTLRDRDHPDDPLAARMRSATYARQLRGRVKQGRGGYVCACTPYTDHPGTGDTYFKGEGRPTQGINVRRVPIPHVARGDDGPVPRTGPVREYHHDRWTPAPTTPAVVVDPFSGTGTVPLVADILGRRGIGVDLSQDYCRLATWRTQDPAQRARAARVDKPPPVIDGQLALEGMA